MHILTRFLLPLVLLVLPALALAQPDWRENPGDPRRTDLEALIEAGDSDAIEAFLADAQARFVAGEVHADDIRRVFEAFATTDPAMIALTRAWLERDPQSPYAQTARGWAMVTAAQLIRGGKFAAKTYPEALNQHTFFASARDRPRAPTRRCPISSLPPTSSWPSATPAEPAIRRSKRSTA
ncbi:MAG: hypothetical protein R3D85_06110 [Paracoccaceae bacterium]